MSTDDVTDIYALCEGRNALLRQLSEMILQRSALIKKLQSELILERESRKALQHKYDVLVNVHYDILLEKSARENAANAVAVTAPTVVAVTDTSVSSADLALLFALKKLLNQ